MMKNALRLTALSLGALAAAGCTTPKQAQLTAIAAPPPPHIEAPPAPPPGLSLPDHLQLVVNLLKIGDSVHAETELKEILAKAPDNKSAQYLTQQIETPIAKLYPKASFRVKLGRDASLPALAQTYLGNPLGFYGLARYNGIAVPAKVTAGQTIRIPKTRTAIAARAAKSPAAAQTPDAADAPAQVASLPANADTDAQAAQKMADQYYKTGLTLFQHQDLDGAIAAWDKVLAIDPNYKDAQLNRAQALQLKENLKKLGG